MHKVNLGSNRVAPASFERIFKVFSPKVIWDEAWADNTSREPQANMTLLVLRMNMFTVDLICSLLLNLKPIASDLKQMKFIIRRAEVLFLFSLIYFVWLFFDVHLFEYFRLLKEQKSVPAVPSVPAPRLMNHCWVSETPLTVCVSSLNKQLTALLKHSEFLIASFVTEQQFKVTSLRVSLLSL